MSDKLDFHLADLVPADADSEWAERRFWASDPTVLAEYHTTSHGSHSYVIAHDGAVTREVPGEPQVAAIKVARDLRLNTFTFEIAYHATSAFAQNWLIERGCPAEHIMLTGRFMQPADDRTLRIEQQIRDSGTRYKVLETQTSDFDPCETWTMVHDSAAVQSPVRVFLEEGDFTAFTYTIREGAFADTDAADEWLEDRSSPLPVPPEERTESALRTRAALARSNGARVSPTASPPIESGPPMEPAQRPNPGRSI
ncbi:glycosyl hydrolase [Streptomyces sp. NPDC001478]